MKWFLGKRAKICRPDMMFEELEPRVVFDASIDVAEHHDLASHDRGHGFVDRDLGGGAYPVSHSPAPAEGQEASDFNVVLISNALPEQDMLIKAASRHAEVLIFDTAKDNLDTINVCLDNMVESSGRPIDHLAVLDHAKAGEWRIGADRFNLFSLPAHRGSFEKLGSLLSDNAQIQLYGCELAGSPMGEALVDRIALYTHADVFASFDKVGGGARHQATGTAGTGDAAIAHLPASVDSPSSHGQPAGGPSVHEPAPPVFMNLPGAKLLHLGHSFAIDDSNPADHVVATVTYDSQPDAKPGLMNLNLHNPKGSSARVEAPDSGDRTWTISGSVEDVNRVLGTMRASTAPPYAGEARVTVATLAPDSQTPASSQTLTIPFFSHETGPAAPLTVPSNLTDHESPDGNVPPASLDAAFPGQTFQPGDPPVIAIESARMSVQEGSAQTIPAITVYDPGSPFVDVVLSADSGTLSAPNPLPHPGVEVKGNNGLDEAVIRMSGFLNDLNDTLKQVTFKPAQGYTGHDRLTVEIHGRSQDRTEMPSATVVQRTIPVDIAET